MSQISTVSPLPPGPGRGKPPRHWVIVRDAFSPEECAALRSAYTALNARKGGLVAGRFDTQVRQSGLVWLPDGETEEGEAFGWVSQRLARLVGDANRDTFRYVLDGFEERLQLAGYGPGHYYDWHIDRGRGAVAGRRKLTLSVQLSDPADYLGGELELNADGHPFQAPRDQGTLIAFAAHTIHRVAPVVTGTRLSLVAWIHGPDFV
ncbi:2OG-Fe(II) oxygenase [Pacificispira sp.]|uniref:2OG-Fe(II) oxygenase n=1 Tax=Pacificispira sp. TaxID=2888761 RepID=UPI003B52BD8B